MATTIQDELYNAFAKVSGRSSALTDVNLTLADVLAQVREMRDAVPAANAKTSATPTLAQTSSQSTGDVLSSVASSVLKNGFGLAPLISGLLSLFGGGGSDAPASLVKYTLPAGIDFQASQSTSGTGGLDYDQAGMPRVYRSDGAAPTWSDSRAGSGSSVQPPSSGPARTSPQITVNVQAMDARSFLDRSNDIALAVRDAMLNMNAINDVVNDL